MDDLADSPNSLEIVHIIHYFQRPGRVIEGRLVPAGHMLFELMTGGRGWIREGDQLQEVGPRDLLWHVPGEGTVCKGDWQNPYSCLAITFRVPREARRSTSRVTRWPEHEQAPNLFAHQATQLWVGTQGDHRFTRAAYLYGRLALAAEMSHEHQLTLESRTELQQAVILIEEDPSRPIRVQDLAEKVGWSISYLTTQFKAAYGMTPYAFIEQRRFERAKALLLASNDAISQVGEQVGLPDPTSFSRRFRQAVGCSPRKYRERAHEA